MFEKTVPTRKVKQRGSRLRMSVGDASAHSVVSEKKTHGPTNGMMASQKERFFPVESRYALESVRIVKDTAG